MKQPKSNQKSRGIKLLPKNTSTGQGELDIPAFMPRSTEIFSKQMTAGTLNREQPYNSQKTSLIRSFNGEFSNIENGITPWVEEENGCFDVTHVIRLCQKAYWNVPIFKSTCDTQAYISNSELSWTGNKKSIKFFQEWWKSINGKSLAGMFFLERFRSSNCLMYRIEVPSGITRNIEKIGRGGKKTIEKTDVMIPIRYIILNPAQIKAQSFSTLGQAEFRKALSPYETLALKNPKTPQDLALRDYVSKEDLARIDAADGGVSGVEMRLSPKYLHTSFANKQDYEPMAIPMYFPVLSDINLKLEFKKAEQVIARTVEHIILLVNVGSEERDDMDSMLLEATTKLFATESVGRILVTDYSTNMEFVIPDLAKVLGPEKYIAVNRDISDGLMNIFYGEQKFSESMIKVKVFLERLNEARQAFLTDFLEPEMQRVGKEFGYKEIPTVKFQDVTLKDEIEYTKVYTRLAELGLLTPSETFTAIETNRLPTTEDSLESQKEFKKFKDSGMYMPLVGGNAGAAETSKGRPTGSKAPRTVKPSRPKGSSLASQIYDGEEDLSSDLSNENDGIETKKFNMEALTKILGIANKFIKDTKENYKKVNNLTRLGKVKEKEAKGVAAKIISSFPKEEWDLAAKSMLGKKPLAPNIEVMSETARISCDYDQEELMAALLYHSSLLPKNDTDETEEE